MFINERSRQIEMSKEVFVKAHKYGTDEYYQLQELRQAYPKCTPVVKRCKKQNSTKGMTAAAIKNYIEMQDADKPEIIEIYNMMCSEGVSHFELITWFRSIHPEVDNGNNVTKYSAKVNDTLTAAKTAQATKRESDKQEMKDRKLQSQLIVLKAAV